MRTQRKISKKTKSVTSKVKTKVKQTAATKKKSTPLPIVNYDTLVPAIATLGERRDNIKRIAGQGHFFDLVNQVPKLLAEFPNCNICISGGSPELSADAQTSIPNLLVHVIPKEKATTSNRHDDNNHFAGMPPPFVAYSAKDVLEIQELVHHELEWHKHRNRVYFLKFKTKKRTTTRSTKALGEDALAMEERVGLWSVHPEQLKRTKKGEYDVRSANFIVYDKKGDPIFDAYEKGVGASLSDYVNIFVDEYGEELPDGVDKPQVVEDAIRQAFRDKRQVLQDHVEMLQDAGFDEELLAAIRVVKIYPTSVPNEAKSSYVNAFYGHAHQVL